jgi:hypothetical protein
VALGVVDFERGKAELGQRASDALASDARAPGLEQNPPIDSKKWHQQRRAKTAAQKPQAPPDRSVNDMVDELFGRKK